MRICIATTSVPGELPERLEAIAEAGFRSAEVNEVDLSGFGVERRAIAKQAAELGLAIDILQPFGDFEGLEGEEREAALGRLDRWLDAMEEIGAGTLLVGTSAHPQASGDAERIEDDLAELAERAEGRGLRAALLALPWSRHIQSEMDALRIVERIDSPCLGLALNSYFSLADGSQAARLRDIPGDRLFHVQISDAPPLDVDLRQRQLDTDLLPGQGGLNLASFVRAIARLGYEGAWSVAQAFGAPHGGGADFVRDAYRALVSLLDGVARSVPELRSPLPHLPPPVHLQGFEFIEFAVDDGSRGELTRMLESLSFRRERRHVSKAVELWRQGAINMLVNAEDKGAAARILAEHGPSVCDMALRVRDARQTVARAKALGMPEFSQPVSARELDIPAIDGIGGTVVHFIDEKTDLHRLWDIDFDRLDTESPPPPAGLRRIDHIAQTMRYEQMQSWLTYYTSTFEMEKTSLTDVADPAGVILSQAVASPEGEVRLTLNGAREPGTFADVFLMDHFGAGVQHIAFATDDIFETSEQLAQAGFPRLPIGDEYYEGLESRFDLDAGLLERLRSGDILYDREGGSEFFQFYSTPLFESFFFEIIQRSGGYDGYGAPNAPARLAALMRYNRGRRQGIQQ